MDSIAGALIFGLIFSAMLAGAWCMGFWSGLEAKDDRIRELAQQEIAKVARG